MKTLKNVVLLTFLLLLSATGLFASEGFEVSFNQPVSSEYDLEFELGDFRLNETQKNGKMFTEIDFAGSVVTNKKGFAALPYIHASVQISPDRNVTTQIISSDYVEYELDHPLVPSRGIIYRNQDPSTIPYEITQESIVDEFYPVNISQTTEPYILRDIRGTNVYVYPFQYNAARNILRVYTNVTVKLTDDNTMPINPITSFSRTIMRDMHHMYSTIFINYDRTRFENELADFGSILVIHTPRDAAAILPYIEWKREKGHTVYVEEVATGTNVISLVSSQYTAHNDILYVQLVGDWADIQGPTSGSSPTDPNLGCVVGGDAYPDLIVGRFCANNTTHVTTQVDKTITYERDPETGVNWYEAATGIASSQGPGDDGELDYEHIDVIYNDKLNPFTYESHTPIYDPAANATMVANALNTGTSIINYCGHGSMTSWGSSGFSNSHIASLTNGDMLPFIISVACNNGEFQSGECFAEAWLHKENGGAIGMYASTIVQSWDPPMRGQDYFNDLLIGGYDYSLHPGQNGITTDVQKKTFGSACFNGSILMTVEEYGGGQPMMETWHVFGDAALDMRTAPPSDLVLSNNIVIMGIDFITTLTTSGVPVEGALICLSQDGNYFTGVSNEFGSVTISHALIVGDAKMVVTAFNTDTIYDDITVIPPGGAYVIFDSFIIDDSSGNNNNLLDYGESVLLDVTLSNVGTSQADNVDATLSTTDQYVTILDDNQNFGNIPAGQTVTQSGAFAFEVDGDVPDGHGILFTLEATDGTDTWTSTFIINAHAPVLEMGSYLIDDTAQGNGDYFWDAGETVDIFITVENNGSSDAFNVMGELLTADPYITINASQADYGDIAIGGSYEESFNATSSPSTPQAHMAIFNVAISSDGEVTGSGSFDVQIGGYLIEEYFTSFPPTGWSIEGGNNWGGNNSNNAGGTAPEADFYWYPSVVSVQRLITMELNTTGSSTLALEFKHYLDDYSGGYSLRVETTSDGINWNTAWEINPTGNVGPEILDIDITTPDVGSSTFQLAFVFDGDSYNLDHWYIDDVILGGGPPIPGYIEGNISLYGGTGNVEEVIVNAGGITTNPDASGNYTMEVIPGTYNVTASLEGYVSQTIEDVEVLEGATTGDIDFVLEPEVGNDNVLIPVRTELTGNFPNPFNPTTTVKYTLHEDSRINLEIFNIKGQKIKTLADGNQSAGYHTIVWDGKDNNGRTSASGLYFYKMVSEGNSGRYTSTKKMLLLK